MGLCSGTITNHSFSKMVQETSPCSVHGFAGTEAKTEKYTSAIPADKEQRKHKRDREFLACLEKNPPGAGIKDSFPRNIKPVQTKPDLLQQPVFVTSQCPEEEL